MKAQMTWQYVVGALVAVSVAMLAETVLGADKPAGCIQASVPKKLDGQVIQVDPDQGKVTVRESSGATHDLRASPETLRSYKVGDRIQATLRPGQECKNSPS